MEKRFVQVLFIILIICFACVCSCGCTVSKSVKIDADKNKFDDIYELENGKYLVVEDNAIGILESLDVKGKETIENFVPETRPLNPHVIGEYIYISQDVSTDEEYKTKVTKIKADSLDIAEEKEFGFRFDCMTSNGKSLVYLGCIDNEGGMGNYLIDGSLNDEYISGEVWTYVKSSGLRRFDEIVYAQFSGNKGIVFAQPEEGYGYLVTVVIENGELKSCCSFCIVECNAQILSTDYNAKLSFIYNAQGTDPMVLTFGGGMVRIEAEQEDLFEARDFSKDAEKNTYEGSEIQVKKEEAIGLLWKGVGVYVDKEKYGKFIDNGEGIYYFRTANEYISVSKFNQGTWKLKIQNRSAKFADTLEDVDYETIIYNVFPFGKDRLYFHLSDKDGYIASGFFDISGKWSII